MANIQSYRRMHDVEYDTWANMKSRCYNVNSSGYKNYGGRGIEVCQLWRNSFEEFFIDMGTRPTSEHSIDRIDNDGNYQPVNCRWATSSQQGRNKRFPITKKKYKIKNRKDIIVLTHNGETKTASEWASITGLPNHIISGRKRRGWTDAECLEVLSMDETKRKSKQRRSDALKKYYKEHPKSKRSTD